MCRHKSTDAEHCDQIALMVVGLQSIAQYNIGQCMHRRVSHLRRHDSASVLLRGRCRYCSCRRSRRVVDESAGEHCAYNRQHQQGHPQRHVLPHRFCALQTRGASVSFAE